MLTLRFEDFEDKDGQKFVIVYCKLEESKEEVIISEELYTQFMNFKEKKVNNGTYQIRSFTTPTGKTITGHLVLDLTRSKLQKKISRKFAKLIPDINQDQKTSECHLFQMSLGSMEFKGHLLLDCTHQ